MNEATVKPQEIKLINPRRTSLIPVKKAERVDMAPIRRKRDRTIFKLYIIIAVLMAVCLFQWGIIYIQQAGPI